MADRNAVQVRKDDHLAICMEQEVEFRRKRTWFEHIEFVHRAVPMFSTEEVDLSVRLLDRMLAAPFIIGAMTGGTPAAREINRKLAAVAAEKGVGLALGSQRPMLENPDLADTYQVRDVAPEILLLGNIGLAQAMTTSAEKVMELLTVTGADGMCLHLNTAMELFQEGGDEFGSRAYVTIGRLCSGLGERLIVKETGCGLARETALRLAGVGVRAIDVAGAGGTCWVRVENLRRGGAPAGMEEFEEWGIPTAASLLEVRGLRLCTIASGGLRTGLDLAKAIALGARIGSAALPVLRALKRGGVEEVGEWLDAVMAGLRAAMVLTGCRDIRTLQRAPLVFSGPLLEWAAQRRLWRPRRERTK